MTTPSAQSAAQMQRRLRGYLAEIADRATDAQSISVENVDLCEALDDIDAATQNAIELLTRIRDTETA